MQASCPQCATRIAIDDAKVPDRAFKVKCPKCHTVVSLPGKRAAPPTAPPPAPEPAPTPPARSEEARGADLAATHREMTPAASAGSAGRALVALADSGQAGSFTLILTHLGYSVDLLSDPEEGVRLIEQGLFAVVVTSRTAAATRNETLYQRISRLSPDSRRRIFLILAGDEFKTGDGTQAWVVLADLVVHSRDVASVDGVLRSTLAERSRLYHAYLDAKERFEATTTG